MHFTSPDSLRPQQSAPRTPARGGPIVPVVVTHDSEGVLEACLDSLALAAPRRGLEAWVVDNCSQDGSARIAARRLGPERVLRLEQNRGFAAGVNQILATRPAEWLAVLNPDVVLPSGALDDLVDVLERHPRAGLVAPRVRDRSGREERSVGLFPTLARERAHAYYLDLLLGREGRHCVFPAPLGEVDWASGCAWVLRGEAVRDVGPLDEEYFMYCEDVDYCRRLRDRGWSVLASAAVEVLHGRGEGSAGTAVLPADGGLALLRYFRKFEPATSEREVRRVLAAGWRLRRFSHVLRALAGNRRSAHFVRRFDDALALMDHP